MLLSEIYKIADEIAPKVLSDELCARYGFYDNSGVLLDAGEEIKGVLFSLDCSAAAVEKAIELGANLIITHHPAIYGKISDIRLDDPLGAKIVRCLRNGISVLSMHLNLDSAQGGLDQTLKEGILRACAKTTGAGTSLNKNPVQDICLYPLTQGGYGQVYDVEEITLFAFAEAMKKEFESDRVLFYGDQDKKITRAVSLCGAGADEHAVLFAKEQGADVIISADFKHHVLTLAQEMGISVIVLTHYASENYGFKKYYKKICQRVNLPCAYHTDENLL